MAAVAAMAHTALPRRRLAALLLALAFLLPTASRTAQAPVMPRRVWFVDNTAADDGDGSLVAPFSRLSRAERAADVGDTIYVFRGDGTSRGLDTGIRLRPYQALLGSGVALVLDGSEAMPAGEPPRLSSTLGSIVVLSHHNTVAGLVLEGVTPDGVESVTSGLDAQALAGAPTMRAGLSGQRVDHLRLSALTIHGGAALDAGIALDTVDGVELDTVVVDDTRHHGLVLADSRRVAVRNCSIATTGEGPEDAAIRIYGGDAVQVVSTAATAGAGVAMAVDAVSGKLQVDLEGVTLAAARGGSAGGLRVRAAGDAELRLAIGALVLQGLAGDGIDIAASGTSRLLMSLAGSGDLAEAKSATALLVQAREGAELSLEARGNELSATLAAVQVTATGHSRVRLQLEDNVVPAVPGGRGFVALLADNAEGALVLRGNQLGGHTAEGIYLSAKGSARLGVDLRDNLVEAPHVRPEKPLASLFAESRNDSRVCLSLFNNRLSEGVGGGPAVTLRQLEASGLGVFTEVAVPTQASGQPVATPVSTLPADDQLAHANRLGKVEVEGGRPLGAAADLPCLPPAPERTPPHSPEAAPAPLPEPQAPVAAAASPSR